MRILHTSDWHLGRYLENVSRMDEQKDFLNELCDTADREGVDLVLVAGDIYDTYNPPAAAEELFYNTMDRLCAGGNRAAVIIAGNHDNPDRLCAASPIAARNGIILLGYPGSRADMSSGSGVSVESSGEGWLELCVNGCGHNAVIITLPYPSESRLEEVLSEDADEKKLRKAYSDKVGGLLAKLAERFRDDTVNLVVSHMLLLGGQSSDSERTIQVGGALTADPAVLPGKAHYAALGHLHRPQRIKAAPCPAYYSGSPLAYSFSEAGYSKAVYLVDAIPGKAAEVREICINSGKPLCCWVAEKGIEEAIAWCEEGRDAGAWVDLEIHTDRVLTVEEQRTLRELHPGIINIRPVIKADAAEVISIENRENKKIDELFRDYYRYRLGTEISEELLGAFLDVLNRDGDEEDAGSGGEADETEVS